MRRWAARVRCEHLPVRAGTGRSSQNDGAYDDVMTRDTRTRSYGTHR